MDEIFSHISEQVKDRLTEMYGPGAIAENEEAIIRELKKHLAGM